MRSAVATADQEAAYASAYQKHANTQNGDVKIGQYWLAQEP